ncbi:protein STPG3-like [Lineus longissimus]|uniref:protein STPG3-like n=1 Tax=Lineus longissimus TaxID=88925 RepID=UPI002B4DB18D
MAETQQTQDGPPSPSRTSPALRTGKQPAASLGNAGHQIARIPSPPPEVKEAYAKKNAERMSSKHRYPPSLVRLATVTMAPKHQEHRVNNYIEGPHQYHKVITLDKAMNARPPLRKDMEGPTPCTYTPQVRPGERNAPSFSFGRKTWPEKDGFGARTSWSKTWFNTPNIWQDKVDFHSERRWPSPGHYPQKSMIGQKQYSSREAPSFTIGTRKDFVMTKKGVENDPSPNEYHPGRADKVVHRSAPGFSHQFRRDTILWNSKEATPDPGQYRGRLTPTRHHRPTYSFGFRREKTHIHGPFATL